MPRQSLCVGVGSTLSRFALDAEAEDIVPAGSLNLRGNIQFAHPSPDGRFLFVAVSDGGPRNPGTRHELVVCRADPSSGGWSIVGEPVPTTARPVHVTADSTCSHLIAVSNHPATVEAFAVDAGGRIGARTDIRTGIECGIYPHQARVWPSDRAVTVVARGNPAEGDRSEDPGSLRTFSFENGRFGPVDVVAPDGGYGFGPRNVDFHPGRSRLYVALESQNQTLAFNTDGDRIAREPCQRQSTLAEPENLRDRQIAGAIAVHPNGRVLYVANRADGTVQVDGQDLFLGGENNIAVFSLDCEGVATPMQHVDTQGIHARTFSLDATGKLMVVANMKPRQVRGKDSLRLVPPSLALFRVASDGGLRFVRKVDMGSEAADTVRSYGANSFDRMMFWTGIVSVPAS